MVLTDNVMDVLILLAFLTTPLVFVASMYFQDTNRESRLFPHVPVTPLTPHRDDMTAEPIERHRHNPNMPTPLRYR